MDRDFDLGTGSDRRVCVAQRAEGDEGAVVWDAAIVLLQTLVHNRSLRREEWEAVELGSGTGAVGLVAAALGLRVVLTDDDVDLLTLNVNRNGLGSRARVCRLVWGRADHIESALDLLASDSDEECRGSAKRRFDLVLVSDCVYYADAVEPLVKTLAALSGPETLTLLSYEERESAEKKRCLKLFFDKLHEYGFRYEYLAKSEYHPDYVCDDIHLLRIRLGAIQ